MTKVIKREEYISLSPFKVYKSLRSSYVGVEPITSGEDVEH